MGNSRDPARRSANDPAACPPAESRSGDAPEFEASLSALEQIVAELESGQLTLTRSIEQYERGVGLLRKCHAALEAARLKVDLLTRVDEDGSVETEPFAADSTDATPRGPSTRRRSGGTPRTPDVDEEKRLF
jgi:exodeoxyribonuclease VII small subunit